MIDHNGQPVLPLAALLHAGGGGLPGVDLEALAKKRAHRAKQFHRTAFGSVAATFESFSLVAPPPPGGVAGTSEPGACSASTRASSTQRARMWTSKPEPPPRFVDKKPATAPFVDASKLRSRPVTRPAGPPELATSSRSRPATSLDYFRPQPPQRTAHTPGHARIAAVRQRNGPRGCSPRMADVSQPAVLTPREAAMVRAAAKSADVGAAEAAASGSAPSWTPKVSIEFEDDAVDGSRPLVRIRLTSAGRRTPSAAATPRSPPAAHPAVVAAHEAVMAASADVDELAELAEARATLRKNEDFFDEMRKRFEAEERAAVTLQASTRGRQTRVEQANKIRI